MKSTITTAVYYLLAFSAAVLTSCTVIKSQPAYIVTPTTIVVEHPIPVMSKPNTQHLNEWEYIKSKQ